MTFKLSSMKQAEKRCSDPINARSIRQKTFLETEDGFYFDNREGCKFGPYLNIEETKMARQLFTLSLTGQETDMTQINNVNCKALFGIERVEVHSLEETRM